MNLYCPKCGCYPDNSGGMCACNDPITLQTTPKTYPAADVERLVEAAKAALNSMENLCDYREDHGPEISRLKAALKAVEEGRK